MFWRNFFIGIPITIVGLFVWALVLSGAFYSYSLPLLKYINAYVPIALVIVFLILGRFHVVSWKKIILLLTTGMILSYGYRTYFLFVWLARIQALVDTISPSTYIRSGFLVLTVIIYALLFVNIWRRKLWSYKTLLVISLLTVLHILILRVWPITRIGWPFLSFGIVIAILLYLKEVKRSEVDKDTLDSI